MLFAGQKYLDSFGAPKPADELIKHRLVVQVADQTAAKEIFDSCFPAAPQRDCWS